MARRRRSEALNRRLSLALKTAADAIYITDVTGTIEYVNPSFEKLTGYSWDEAVGQKPNILKSGLMSRQYYGRLWESLLRGEFWREEVVDRKKNGELYTAQQSISPIKDSRGRIEGFVAIQHDSSESAALEAALRERESAYRLLAENATDMIARLDARGRFTYVSPSCLALTGFEPRELLDRDPGEFLEPSDQERLAQQRREALMNKQSLQRSTYRFFRKDGTPVWIENASRHLFDSEGRLRESITVSRDIEDRKRVEAELTQARDVAERADQAKSAFLANMSHELRTPLNAILGFGGLVLQETAEPGQRHRLERLLSAGQHLVELVNDLLDLSKLEAGMLELHPEACDLSVLIQDLLGLFSWKIDPARVQLRFEKDPKVPAWVRVDQLRLRQILLNLIGNAVKFTERGFVRVRLHWQETDIHSGRGLLTLHVEDSGIGISPEAIKDLFQPFRQIESAQRARYGGTGLGLAISLRLARQMGGSLSVTSVPGEGSIFSLNLPDCELATPARSSLEAGSKIPEEPLEPPELSEPQKALWQQRWAEQALGVRARGQPEEQAAWAQEQQAWAQKEGLEPLLPPLTALAKAAELWDIGTISSLWLTLEAMTGRPLHG